MAVTLPYPDLDFVPLDVLTAEEMNQIVANYTYIANNVPELPPTVKPGDSVTWEPPLTEGNRYPGYLYCAGTMTSSSKSVRFTIPTPFHLDSTCNSVTITKCEVTIRVPAGGYLSADTTFNIVGNGLKYSILPGGDNIAVTLERTSWAGGATVVNNSVFNVEVHNLNATFA